MRDHYDFSKARKNPFAGMFKDGYIAEIEYEGYKEVVRFDHTKNPPTRELIETIYDSGKVVVPVKEAAGV